MFGKYKKTNIKRDNYMAIFLGYPKINIHRTIEIFNHL